MASTWRFQQENSTRLARLGLTDPSSGIQSRQMPFVEGGGPDDKQGSVLADALNVHEATGLTPSQLQARVAELEAALRELLSSTSLKEIGKSTGFRDLLVTGDDVRAGFKALGEA